MNAVVSGGDLAASGWTVGHVAATAGVTVRTLHHYDQLGLVQPSERTPAGHRRYAAADVARLYRVLVLRQLGLGLSQIGELLCSEDPGHLLTTVRQQLAYVDGQLADLSRLQRQLTDLADRLARNPAAASDMTTELLETIHMTVQLTHIYTRTGDDGRTGLGDGSRVDKTDARIEALGDIDELNAQIGATLAATPIPHPYAEWLHQVQNDLLDAGADICVPADDEGDHLRLRESYVERLERHCDTANEPLASLRSFVHPGGSPAAAQLHLCRTVCRRAERHTLAIEHVSANVARYLNRLSDLFFILARAVDSRPPALWEPAANISTG